MASSPLMIWADHCATSSSRSVSVLDWKSARSRIEYFPAGTKPPASLVADTLIHGSGETVQSGRTLVIQYTGVDWNTGKNFDSSFTHKQAFSTVIGGGKVIKGWDQGLVGKHVGDRVLLVIPPALGYGPSGGQADAGIGANDTLVFVVDIIDAL